MSELKRLAEASKNNDPWWPNANEINDQEVEFESVDAAYIAAASPDAILKLIEERDRLMEALTHIASFSEGETVNSSFDEPHSAEAARQALEAL